MSIKTLEARIETLERRITELEQRLNRPSIGRGLDDDDFFVQLEKHCNED